MADLGGFNVPTPQEILAALSAQRQKVMVGGNVQQQRSMNIESGLDNLLGNPQVRQAKVMQQRIASATQGLPSIEGEDDLTREMRRLQAIRDSVSDISPDTASQITTQLLKLGQMRLEQGKLKAEETRAAAAEGRAVEDQGMQKKLFPLQLEAQQQEIDKNKNEGQNYWRISNGQIQRQNTTVLDSLDRARLRKEGWTEGSGPTTEAETSDALGLTKPVTTDLQTSLISAQNSLDGFAQISQKYDPEFLTWGAQVKNWGRAAIEKAGVTLPADQAAKLQRFSEFRANTMDSLNRTIKLLAGTAVSKSELERMLKANPNAETDSNSQFLAKLRNKVRDVLSVQKRAQQALASGLQVSGDKWDTIATPPVSEAEVDAFLQNKFGVPSASGASDQSLIDRYK